MRGLAAEGRLQLRDFLSDPSLRVFGRSDIVTAWCTPLAAVPFCELARDQFVTCRHVEAVRLRSSAQALLHIHRDLDFSSFAKLVNSGQSFDLSKFRGSFSRSVSSCRRPPIFMMCAAAGLCTPGVCVRGT